MSLLACPECRADVTLQPREWEGEECMAGDLTCSSCSSSWAVVRGVPRFAPTHTSGDQAETAENFGWQWSHFTQEDERYAAQFLGWIPPVRPEDFLGQVVLDAGCGKGRHTSLTARWGAQVVVGVDLGDGAVETAFAHTRDLNNAHIVQADLHRLPLKPVFDHVFSVGVLHHTPDPGAAFSAVASAVKPGGRLSAWVYGAENNGWITRFVNPLRRHTSRMPPRLLLHASKAPAAVLLVMTRGVYGPANRIAPRLARRLFYNDYLVSLSSFGWREHHTIVFDHLVAPTAFYISRQQFESWWRDLGASEVTITWTHRNSWSGSGHP